jgi:hypothetical protein
MSNEAPVSPDAFARQASENALWPADNPATSTKNDEHEQTLDKTPPKTEAPAKSSSVTSRFQWRPLGTVRDYFTEQMRQDEFR